MRDHPRRQRARLWATVYAAIFRPEDGSETDADEERDTEGNRGTDEESDQGSRD